MPAMSPTMTEGGISSWKKHEGESFAAGDVLVEIVGYVLSACVSSHLPLQETDKATIDVEAQDDGVLAKIVANNGAKNIAVGSPIAIIGEQGDDLSGATELAEQSSASSSKEGPVKQTGLLPSSNKEDSGSASPLASPAQQAGSPKSFGRDLPKGDRIFASPIAKKIALERGIPLAQLKGSGPDGRIIRSDVDSYTLPSPTIPSASTAPPPASSLDPPYTDIPVSNMRRTIGQRLSKSKQEVPHYYVTIEIHMDRLLKIREVFNQKLDKPDKLSINDFIVKGAALALRDVPEANSAWLGESIRQYVVTCLPTLTI